MNGLRNSHGSTTSGRSRSRTSGYAAAFSNPFVAARRGFIDDVIMPRATRAQVCRALSMLRSKRLENPWKKHGNMPL